MAKLGFKIKFTKSVFGATQRAKIKKRYCKPWKAAPNIEKRLQGFSNGEPPNTEYRAKRATFASRASVKQRRY